MIAFVLGVIFSSSFVGSIHQVWGSTSTKTGRAPARITTLALTMSVKSGMITSSPSPMPKATKPKCSAPVPLLQAIPWRAPQ